MEHNQEKKLSYLSVVAEATGCAEREKEKVVEMENILNIPSLTEAVEMKPDDQSQNQEKDLPSKAYINTGKGMPLELSESAFYSHILKEPGNWASDEVFYAWRALCKFSGIVRNWRQFALGTMKNLRKKEKSLKISQATNNKTHKDMKSLCKTRKSPTMNGQKKNYETSTTYKEDSSEVDSSEQASQPLVSLSSMLKDLSNGSKTQICF